MDRLQFRDGSLLRTVGLISICLFSQLAISADSSAEKPRTFPEMLAIRPEPDLSTLVERSAPEKSGPDASESFLDILKLRDSADSKSVSVLEKILIENKQSTRFHGFAAAQALFSIGTPEAHQVLEHYVFTEQRLARLRINDMAIGYTSHWGMREPSRSQFIEKYLLKNLSKSLVVEVQQTTLTNPAKEGSHPIKGLSVVVILRNASNESFHLIDHEQHFHSLLHLRDAEGRFIPNFRTRTCCPSGRSKYMELKPGETHHINLTIEVVGADDRHSLPYPPARWTAQVKQTGHGMVIDAPGQFQLIAVYEQAFLTPEGRAFLNVDENWKLWSGRTVSKPLFVDVETPELSDTSSLK